MIGEDSDQTLDAQADLSLCWSHESNCKFCRAVSNISTLGLKKRPYLQLCNLLVGQFL